jgi:hypothetical protein
VDGHHVVHHPQGAYELDALFERHHRSRLVPFGGFVGEDAGDEGVAERLRPAQEIQMANVEDVPHAGREYDRRAARSGDRRTHQSPSKRSHEFHVAR